MRKAVKWYRCGAEAGDTAAQINLGVCYTKGTGVTADMREAFKWYMRAAKDGLAMAQRRLLFFGRPWR